MFIGWKRREPMFSPVISWGCGYSNATRAQELWWKGMKGIVIELVKAARSLGETKKKVEHFCQLVTRTSDTPRLTWEPTTLEFKAILMRLLKSPCILYKGWRSGSNAQAHSGACCESKSLANLSMLHPLLPDLPSHFTQRRGTRERRKK